MPERRRVNWRLPAPEGTTGNRPARPLRQRFMLALVCSLAMVERHKAVEIASFPKAETQAMGPFASPTVLLDDGTAAGYYCESTGAHGESLFAKPFVVAGCKLTWLPLGGKKYGHVFAGAGDRLVGDVDQDGLGLPAMWKRDPKLGWAKARLSVISQEYGWAAVITPNGTIWMRSGKTWRTFGGRSSGIASDHFDLFSVDTAGRLYGNRFDSYGLGNSRVGESPGFFAGASWTNLPLAGSVGTLTQANPDGVAIGRVGTRAAFWKNGSLGFLATPSSTDNRANAINSQGEIVGSFYVGERSHACVWKQGKVVDLIDVAPRVKLVEALCVNSRGAIVARTDRGEKLYLLTPGY